MKNSQSGFASITMLILFAFISLGTGTYFYMNKSHATRESDMQIPVDENVDPKKEKSSDSKSDTNVSKKTQTEISVQAKAESKNILVIPAEFSLTGVQQEIEVARFRGSRSSEEGKERQKFWKDLEKNVLNKIRCDGADACVQVKFNDLCGGFSRSIKKEYEVVGVELYNKIWRADITEFPITAVCEDE